MNKENWIEDILKSAKDIRSVDADPFMVTIIESKLQQPAINQQVPLRLVYAFALTMTILVILNITAWQYQLPTGKDNGIQQMMQEYGWSNQDLYSLNTPK